MSAAEHVLCAIKTALYEYQSADAHGPYAAVYVAFSGGVDSTVLLEALYRSALDLGLPRPRALHVDHGLNAHSARWSAHCRAFCEARGLQFDSIVVDAHARHGDSPEQAARNVRYQALNEFISGDDLLLLAHHADDQAETMLLQIARGAGPLGSAGMRAQRQFNKGQLLRPLLNIRRNEIEQCAHEWNLQWIEDPSNAHLRHPRNRLRKELVPLLEKIMPGSVTAFGRSAQLQREAAAAVEQLALIDIELCRGAQAGALSCESLRRLDSARRRAVLRAWLADLLARHHPAQSAAHWRLPSYARLCELERQICVARSDSKMRIELFASAVEMHADELLLFKLNVRPFEPSAHWHWPLSGSELRISSGRLVAQWQQAGGLRLDKNAQLEVRFRAGGERFKPAGRQHSQTLKRLLQSSRVPVWKRQGLPLLYHNDELVAVADLWVSENYLALSGTAAWRLRWYADQQPLV